MVKILSMLFTLVITSFYFFPFQFTFLPAANTKMIVAAFGAAALLINLAKGKSAIIDKGFFILVAYAAIISLFGLLSVTINATPDYTYATYIVSMLVWTGGAYAVTRLIKSVHQHVSIQLVCNYLIAVSMAQCIIAFAMGQYPPFKDFVDSFLAGEGFMGKTESRLYGIGAALDVAGMRFATVLVMIAYFCVNTAEKLSKKMLVFYIAAFFIISIIGNMIGRSTTVGMVIAAAYWIWAFLTPHAKNRENLRWFGRYFLCALIIVLPIIIYLYYTDAMMQQNIRFGFEGFFSLFSTGHWETSSNEILKNMYVFPDSLHTWLIGDGYFGNPDDTDPYYTGHQWIGFYKDTDVGYLRLLFYFGLAGLISFILYLLKATQFCCKNHPRYRLLFITILCINYIMWFKVASDLFLILALFICVEKADDTETKSSLNVKVNQ